MPARELARSLHEADGPGHDVVVVEGRSQVEPQGPPGTSWQPTQQAAVEVEEDSEPLGPEDDLPMGDLLEEFPSCPSPTC
jgi:hypothetical protein